MMSLLTFSGSSLFRFPIRTFPAVEKISFEQTLVTGIEKYFLTSFTMKGGGGGVLAFSFLPPQKWVFIYVNTVLNMVQMGMFFFFSHHTYQQKMWILLFSFLQVCRSVAITFLINLIWLLSSFPTCKVTDI